MEYVMSPEMKVIADKVIAENDELAHLRGGSVRIGYQIGSGQRKHGDMFVFGDCTKATAKTKAFSNVDFVITFYAPNVENLKGWQLERLMFHELLHIGYAGEDALSINPHDIGDFRACIEKWGIDWLGTGDVEHVGK